MALIPYQSQWVDRISLNGSHVQNPFLLRREVQSIYSKVFLSTSEDKQGKASERNAKQSFFRAFMILAIGSVLPYRNGEFEHHPYGYYLSALKYFDDSFLSGGLASIQDLLLVSRFAIYHYVGETNAFHSLDGLISVTHELICS